MALHASWEGFLRLSLISVPVRAYNAAAPNEGTVHFHQIHRDCGHRINYKKVCPIHGEVNKEEIVSGYEFKKGEYVLIEKDELDKLQSQDEKTINIDAFLPANKIDLIYLSGRTYFLVPAGPAGREPFALLREVMKEKSRYAVGTMVLSGHDEAILIRPLHNLLSMTVFYHEDQIKSPSAFEDEVKDAKVKSEELRLAGVLVDESTSNQLDLGRYRDQYTERVTQALQAKLGGKTHKAPRREKTPHVINLMDALRKSVQRSHSNGTTRHDRGRSRHSKRTA